MLKMIKTSYGKIKKLSSPEAAYIAALIDGEGTVTLTNHSRSKYRRLQVEIGNTDLELLKWVKNSIGAGQILLKRPYNERQALSYTYKIHSRQALNLLNQISSYLKTYKRKRAELVLKNYIKLTPRNGKYSPELLSRKEKFIKAFFSIPSPRKIMPKITLY
jgi:hypothetical protein